MPFSHDDYPKPISYRGGCKVCWRTYDSMDSASKAADVARRLAKEMENQGYEWGYCSPGEIRVTNDGLLIVTCP